MRDQNPSAQSGQNLDGVDFENTDKLKQEITKKKETGEHDEL